MENLLFREEAGIGFVTLHRPGVLNALNLETLLELGQVADAIATSDTIHAVVVTGSDKAFGAGADIRTMLDMTPLQARDWALRGKRVLDRIASLPQPVLAAIEGFCLGGCMELALACDIRLAGEGSLLGLPESTLATIPGFGGTQRLTGLVGPAKSKELLFLGSKVPASQALEIGLVNAVVPKGEALSAATEMARSIMRNGSVAVALCKRCVDKGMESGPDAGQAIETEAFALSFSTHDRREGMSAFLEKRPPSFRHR